MRNVLMLITACLFMFSCSNDEVSAPQADNGELGSVTFDISAVNQLSTGVKGGPLYSQEATQSVTRVTIYAFKDNGSGYMFVKSYDVSGWTAGMTFKRFSIPADNKLDAGAYKFLAVGRDASDLFSVTNPAVGTTSYSSMMATIQNSGDESEIFAGSADAEVMPEGQGTRVSIEMTRKVAGVLGYFKNVPQEMNNKTVRYLRLTASNSNQQVNLTTGTGVNTNAVVYNIINMDLGGQQVSGGLYVGNDLSGQGVQKVPNSQLAGAFFMPVSGITLTLGLYDTNGDPIKTWSVKDASNANSDIFTITANHFYSLGMKKQAGNTTGGTSDPGDADDPIDLLTDQDIVITISPDWSAIHNLVIQ